MQTNILPTARRNHNRPDQSFKKTEIGIYMKMTIDIEVNQFVRLTVDWDKGNL